MEGEEVRGEICSEIEESKGAVEGVGQGRGMEVLEVEFEEGKRVGVRRCKREKVR